MVNVYHAQLARHRITAYLDYVPSKANIADLPSRNEFTLLTSLGSVLVPYIIPSADSWRAPLEHWIE